MKKFLSIFLIAVMVLSSVNAFALTDSSLMEEVLIKVKSRINVPEELTEFNASERQKTSYDDNKEIFKYFQFEWNDTEYSRHLTVQADSNGNISEYNYTDSKIYDTKSAINIKKETALKSADEFVRRVLPDCFSDNDDIYVLNEELFTNSTDFSGNRLTFTFVYNRICDGYPVYGNDAFVTVSVVGSECVVTSLRSGWDYNANIIRPDKELISDSNEKYLEKFPIELIYQDNYVPYKINADSDKKLPELYYRFKDHNTGYISATDGEIVERVYNDYRFNYLMKEEMAADSANGAMAPSLTKEEIEKLEEISGMISEDDALNLLKENKYLDIGDNFRIVSSGLYKQSANDKKYIRNIELGYSNSDYQNIYASFDGVSGELISYRRNVYGPDNIYKDATVDQNKTDAAKSLIDEFVNSITPRIGEYKLYDEHSADNISEKTYERYVNGVRYINNRIYVCCYIKGGFISQYSINYNENLEGLTNPADAISESDAHKRMFEISPLKLQYVPSKSGYVLCYGFGDDSVSDTMIYAISGESVNKESKKVNISEYTDVSGHWCEKEANELSNIGIGFEDGKLNPDEKCSQYELLRLFTSAINKGNRYMSYTPEDLYSYLERLKYLTEDEMNQQGTVLREDAFVYAVRIMGHREIAELNDIYRTSFLDNQLIPVEKIGSAAILKGFGIISGDGTYVRPKDEITRAEAIVMAHRLLTKR